jgi:hypothetical protein
VVLHCPAGDFLEIPTAEVWYGLSHEYIIIVKFDDGTVIQARVPWML